MLINGVINFKLNINGIEIKVFPFLSLISALCMVKEYSSLSDLQNNTNKGDVNIGEFERQLYGTYRNLLIHLS